MLRTAAADGFEAFLTIDKKMEHEQNLLRLPLPIVMLDAISTDLVDLLPLIPAVEVLLLGSLLPSLYVIGTDGNVRRITAPRPKP